MIVSERDLYIFLKCIVSGWQNTLYPNGSSDTKLYSIGCLKPFTTNLSKTSHFQSFLSSELQFLTFSPVYTLGLPA